MTSIACGFLNNKLDNCFRYIVICVSQRCEMNYAQLAKRNPASESAYLCNRANNGTSISIEIVDLVNIHADLVEVVFALIKQRFLVVLCLWRTLHRRLSK